MADILMYIPKDNTQNYSFCRLGLVIEKQTLQWNQSQQYANLSTYLSLPITNLLNRLLIYLSFYLSIQITNLIYRQLHRNGFLKAFTFYFNQRYWELNIQWDSLNLGKQQILLSPCLLVLFKQPKTKQIGYNLENLNAF